LVPFRGLELLDNCFRAKIFARKNFGAKSCWLQTNLFIWNTIAARLPTLRKTYVHRVARWGAQTTG
ncbi:MAG: hypothetical protein DRR19_22275, partial [Candidatus Parabeggiatoa sp. nov. 1]